jgi:hypothetical protein
VIGECGGAMETSRCPDCGGAVGGANHTLLATNRALEQSPYARMQGQLPAPDLIARVQRGELD